MARPQFKPTAAQKRLVAISGAGGMTHQEIAIAIGISKPTLEKHFAEELSIGPLQKRMEVLSAMHQAAKKGNVAAQRAFLALTPTLGVPPIPPEPPAAKPAPLGKKDQANADAVVAQTGTDWEQLLTPPTRVQ